LTLGGRKIGFGAQKYFAQRRDRVANGAARWVVDT
jgi:hypothetical protein